MVFRADNMLSHRARQARNTNQFGGFFHALAACDRRAILAAPIWVAAPADSGEPPPASASAGIRPMAGERLAQRIIQSTRGWALPPSCNGLGAFCSNARKRCLYTHASMCWASPANLSRLSQKRGGGGEHAAGYRRLGQNHSQVAPTFPFPPYSARSRVGRFAVPLLEEPGHRS